MKFGELLKDIRAKPGLSQKDMARMVGVTQATWSMYESGKLRIPDDILSSLTAKLKDPRLTAYFVFDRKRELFNSPMLDNVDDNPIVVLDCMIEEAAELIESASMLKKLLRNKEREDLTEKEVESMIFGEEQIVDLLPCIKLNLVRMNEIYGLDLQALEEKVNLKYKYKKYVKSENRQNKKTAFPKEYSL